jgi:DNA-binding transcriptional LysR family regulator
MARNWTNRLRGISTFIRSADTGSFSKAALELGITPQAVSAQIKQIPDGAAAEHSSASNAP